MKLKASLGTGRKTCGCSGCGEVFTSLSGFDRHQRAFKCLPPAQVGLIQKPNGRWSLPPRNAPEES